MAPTKRVARALTGGVQGPALGPLVGSRGKAPGGGPGGGAPGSSQVLASLSAFGELSFISLS